MREIQLCPLFKKCQDSSGRECRVQAVVYEILTNIGSYDISEQTLGRLRLLKSPLPNNVSYSPKGLGRVMQGCAFDRGDTPKIIAKRQAVSPICTEVRKLLESIHLK